MYKNIFKSIIDFFVSLLILCLTSPILIFTIFLLAINNKGKVFYVQPRSGKNNIVFKIFKFKTMNDNCDEKGELLLDAQRLTKIGKFVRKTSIDELPQLINVLKGEMSLIGPRPLLTKYLSLYNDFQKRRHEVKPGITGLTQVNGRNTINWQQRFEYDVWYVENLSFALDIKILLKTIVNVLKSKDINSPTTATMEEFLGN